MDDRRSRRGVLASAGALTLTALAGCTGDGSNATDTPATETPRDTTRAQTTTDGPGTTASDAPAVDWDEVADFRTWLTDYSTLPSSNSRFDYQSVGLEQVVGAGRASFLDLSTDAVDGFLTTSGNAFYLGDFDADALVDAVEDSPDHELTGDHEGYTTAEATETGTEVAVGDDAVLAGSELSVWIDAHVGQRARLEETDPVFTELLARLPERGIVAAQYGPPAGGEIDAAAIDAWGTSMASLDADTGTWVYAFEPGTGEAVVDDVAAGLTDGAFTTGVTDRSRDGRFVTFTATLADLE